MWNPLDTFTHPRWRNARCAIVGFLALVCCAGAKPPPKPNYDDAPPKVAAYLRRRDEATQYRIGLLKTFAKAGDRKSAANAKQQLKRLRQGQEKVSPTIVGLKVGEIGVLDAGSITVTDVVDERNAIIEFSSTTVRTVFEGIVGGPRPTLTAKEKFTTKSTKVWLRGIDTSRLSDGAKITLSGVFEVTGNNKSYTTGLAETLVVIEPFDMQAVQEYLASKSSAPTTRPRNEPAKAGLDGDAPLRTWTSTGEKFKIQAEFVGVDDGNVRLKKSDGKLITVALDKLSDDDRQYVKLQLAKRLAEGNAATESDDGEPADEPDAPGKRDRYPLTDVRFLDWKNKTWENNVRDGFQIDELPQGYYLKCDFAGGYEQRMIAFPKEDPKRRMLVATFEITSGECEIGIRPANLAPRGARISSVFTSGRTYRVELSIRGGQAVATINGSAVNVSQDAEGNGIFAIVVSRRCVVAFQELFFVDAD
ncbi:MAG TPA: SHD1 domain-containing protein [Pirellulales bacterium]|nr:SHD1 domain-containing protein [Pirellulales bacterium]